MLYFNKNIPDELPRYLNWIWAFLGYPRARICGGRWHYFSRGNKRKSILTSIRYRLGFRMSWVWLDLYGSGEISLL